MPTPLPAFAVALAVAAVIADGAAAAPECGRWQASVASLAGEGRALNARVCLPEKPAFGFEITCRGRQDLHLRFLADTPTDADFNNRTVTVAYRIGEATHSLASRFEALDGAFAADVAMASPLIAALQSGAEAIATIPGTSLPEHRIPLAGSRAALDALIAHCRRR